MIDMAVVKEESQETAIQWWLLFQDFDGNCATAL